MINKRKIKILWLWESIDKLGGVEILLLNLARKIDRDRYEVVLAVNNCGKLSTDFERLGIKVVNLKRKRRFDFKSFFRLYQLVRTLRIDIIHTHGYYFGLRGRVIGKILGKPAICTYHASFDKEAKSYRIRLTTKLTLPLASYATFVSLAGESSFHRDKPLIFTRDILPNRKYFTIYNGVNIKEIQERLSRVDKVGLRKELGIREGEKIIVNIGRLSYEKGHSYLVEAMKKVAEIAPSAKLFVIGDGELKARLTSMTTALGLGNNLFFLGERKDAIEILAIANMFVYQSLWGSLGLALLEAIAAGVPVVAPENAGVYELIRNGENGLVHRPSDPDSIYICIRKLLEDDVFAKKIALEAQKDIRDTFSIDHSIDSYYAIYDHLSNRSAG